MCANTTDLMQAWAAIGGLIVSIVGFLFVYKQIKQVNSSIKSNTHSSIATNSFECSRFLFENIELYKYFYQNIEPDKNSKDYDKAYLFSEIIMDHFQFIFLERENMDKEIFEKWKLYMKGLYSTSPILKLYLTENRSTYDSGTAQLLENA